jgi:hypothetical protein
MLTSPSVDPKSGVPNPLLALANCKRQGVRWCLLLKNSGQQLFASSASFLRAAKSRSRILPKKNGCRKGTREKQCFERKRSRNISNISTRHLVTRSTSQYSHSRIPRNEACSILAGYSVGCRPNMLQSTCLGDTISASRRPHAAAAVQPKTRERNKHVQCSARKPLGDVDRRAVRLGHSVSIRVGCRLASNWRY